MKIAVTGVICKDIIFMDGKIVREGAGGSILYESKALNSFGVKVKAFGTYDIKDDDLVKKEFTEIDLKPIYVTNTLTHELYYKKENPNVRETKVPEYGPNVFSLDEKILEELKEYDYIFLGPLYFENLPLEFFNKMWESKLILNNFGFFTYFKDGKPIKRSPEKLDLVAPFLQCLSMDEEEMRFSSRKNSIEEGAHHFLNLGTKEVIVTKGSNGSEIYANGKKYIIPAFPPIELVDPTGAGDTYLSAYIYAESLFGNDIEKRGRFAAMAATIAIEKLGVFKGNTREVLSRLQK